MNKIRQCRSEDIPALIELFRSVYKFNPRLQEPDYFDWQFRNTPFAETDEYTFLVMENSDSIKGFLGYVPMEYRSGNDIKTGCWTYNWFSADKDGSGLKLLGALMEKYDSMLLLGYNSTSEPIFRMYKMSMANLPRWVAILDAEKAANLLNISSDMNRNLLNNSYKRLSQIGGDTGDIHICDKFEPGEEYIFDHWKSIRNYCRRTGAYLNWRYVDIPRHDYRIIMDDGRQFAVYRIENIKGSEHSAVRILEWNFYGNSAEHAMAFIIRDGSRSNAILADFFCTARELASEFERLGFVAAENFNPMIPFLFRPLCSRETMGIAIDIKPHRQDRDLSFDEWYITKGESDMDRIKL